MYMHVFIERSTCTVTVAYNMVPASSAHPAVLDASEVQNGHATIARFLIDVGAKVDIADDMGKTPLSCAAAGTTDAGCVQLREIEQ